MRRIFIKAKLADKLVIDGSDGFHLSRVMRAKLGDHIVVADDVGQVGEYEITGFGTGGSEDGGLGKAQVVEAQPHGANGAVVELSFVQRLEEWTESPIELVLAQCLPKGDKLELITQKATELGVNRIVPLVSENCVVKYDAKKSNARQERWQKIANEAGKQCGRTILPVVEPIQSLTQWLTEMANKVQMSEKKICLCMCYENEEQQGIKEFLQVHRSEESFIFIVGPEGGFSLAEAHLAQELGIASVSLGTRILRAETAAIAAAAIIQYENGDLGGR